MKSKIIKIKIVYDSILFGYIHSFGNICVDKKLLLHFLSVKDIDIDSRSIILLSAFFQWIYSRLCLIKKIVKSEQKCTT